MAYRRTDRVIARLAARQDAILTAARALAAEGGIGAVQIVPVAERAGIAAGTVYRYFPSKEDLVAAVIDAVADQEIAALHAAATSAPGPLSALAAAVMGFSTRALRERRLAWAMFAETAEGYTARLALRRRLASEFETLIRSAITAGHLPDQDAALAAAAVIGAVLESLVGPLAPAQATPEATRNATQTVTLFALRALGVVDARARGLVISQG